MKDKGLLGLFDYADTLIKAGEVLKESGYSITIFSPVPLGHELDHSKIGSRPNMVKWFALVGTIAGCIAGLVLTIGTAMLYVLPRGGRPIVFMTPTLLMAYETTILFGVILTLIGFLIMARKPNWGKLPYDPIVNEDAFGLYVNELPTSKYEEVEKIMREYGATNVKVLEPQ